LRGKYVPLRGNRNITYECGVWFDEPNDTPKLEHGICPCCNNDYKNKGCLVPCIWHFLYEQNLAKDCDRGEQCHREHTANPVGQFMRMDGIIGKVQRYNAREREITMRVVAEKEAGDYTMIFAATFKKLAKFRSQTLSLKNMNDLKTLDFVVMD